MNQKNNREINRPEEKSARSATTYLHGYSTREQDRLRRQAAFAEYIVFRDVNFSGVEKLLEIGCGVGAQSEILLRRFPKLSLNGVDVDDDQIRAARSLLDSLPYASGRVTISKMDAGNLDFDSGTFDAAFICWMLEHVSDPARVLSEVRRVVRPGGQLVVTEVMNSSFFLNPYCPHVWKYWMACNDFQYDRAGDPFIGVKLGNLLMSQGFKGITTRIKTWHLDNRQPVLRRNAILEWSQVLMSAAEQLVQAGYVTAELIGDTEVELKSVANDPNAVFYNSFMQAQARV